MPGLMLQDSWRYSFFALGRGGHAFLNDTVWAVTLIPALVFLRASGHADVFWFTFAWGATGAAAAAIGPFQARVLPNVAGAWRWMSDHRDLGFRYLLEGISGNAVNQVRGYGVGVILGLAAVGYVQASLTLMGPMTILFLRDVPGHHTGSRPSPAALATAPTDLLLARQWWAHRGVARMGSPASGHGSQGFGELAAWSHMAANVSPGATADVLRHGSSCGRRRGHRPACSWSRTAEPAPGASHCSYLQCIYPGRRIGGRSHWHGDRYGSWRMGRLDAVMVAIPRSAARVQRRTCSWLAPAEPPGWQAPHNTVIQLTGIQFPAIINLRLSNEVKMTDEDRPRNALSRRWRIALVTLPVVAVVAIAAIWAFPGGHSTSPADPNARLNQGQAPPAAMAICGRPILNSPWHYDGPPGTYVAKSEPVGLPTFGSPKSDFPGATRIIVVPAGDNTSAASTGVYNVDNTVVYFEPGIHDIEKGMYTGHESVYAGGYTAAAGKAVIDGVDGATNGTGRGGERPAYSTPSSGNNVYDTWEYLTIENFTSSQNNSVMGNVNGGGSDIGDVYKYDTIGPNEYGFQGDDLAPKTGESSGGGYAIDAGGNTTIRYDCLTRNAQGAFNIASAVNLNIENNEISWNGLGEYPDSAGSGGSPYACGCSGGGKIFFSLNANVVGNYIHDNYNAGIWFDFDNSGANISHNFIASNWGSGIIYEASYNANISDNTLVGNGWASDGAWPAGVGGGSCYAGVSCTHGYGPVTGAGGGNPYAAIDTSNSGGNNNLHTVTVPAGTTVPGCSSSCTINSRYSGELLVENNVLQNNFGGVKVYTDTNRFPGNIDNDSACGPPLGVLDQPNSAMYYDQSKVLTTGADATITGSFVISSGGTKTICVAYGTNADLGPGINIRAPAKGMAVYDQNSGAFLGTVVNVTSAHAFTLSRLPGNKKGVTLLLSAYGGCGPADYYGAEPGITSGRPLANYWDNCIWGSRNVTVKGNVFSIDASTVRGCDPAKNLCGYMENAVFNAGVARLLQFWDSYQDYIAKTSGGLGDVWSYNTYRWSGGGSGGWQFWAAYKATTSLELSGKLIPTGKTPTAFSTNLVTSAIPTFQFGGSAQHEGQVTGPSDNTCPWP